MKTFLLLLLFSTTFNAIAQQTPFEQSKGEKSATYAEAISFYKGLARKYPQARLISYGETDFGEPLQLLVLSKDKTFDPQAIRQQDKSVLLINNGIHPGEPEGVDASMMLARDLLRDQKLPEKVVICIIPLYNIDGSYNRSSTSRANQNGPVQYGFRGNSKNYDLNRDFIKTDSRNSWAFQQIFNVWQPEVFVDTHTSNGADYQYTMTLIPTQKDKLQSDLSTYLTGTMLPHLYQRMAEQGFELIPYVNSVKETPESGIEGFLETARYSTGYAALHNSIGFMPETHMLKPFDQRVKSTYVLLHTYINFVNTEARQIKQNKLKADLAVQEQTSFPLVWSLDQSQWREIAFKGYEAKYKASEVSGAPRLYYDRQAPYTKKIKEWNTFIPTVTVDKPRAYVIPKAWHRVIELLKLNRVSLHELKEDVIIPVDSYYIKDLKTSTRPYEGHYIHSQVALNTVKQKLQYYKGDFVIFVNQPQNRYIVETLEPQATDSFFNWNFFDAILGQKEHYSAYVFEDTAAAILRNNPQLKARLEKEKTENPELAKSPAAQLDFIYKNSDYYEKTHMRYPIGRLVTDFNLSLK